MKLRHLATRVNQYPPVYIAVCELADPSSIRILQPAGLRYVRDVLIQTRTLQFQNDVHNRKSFSFQKLFTIRIGNHIIHHAVFIILHICGFHVPQFYANYCEPKICCRSILYVRIFQSLLVQQFKGKHLFVFHRTLLIIIAQNK